MKALRKPNRCLGDVSGWRFRVTFHGVLCTQQHVRFIFASLWCSVCCWKAEMVICALSVESLFHLDLGSQGCPGPACYHLNHMLIPPPWTQHCWINNGISVKQLLLRLISPSVPPPVLHICCPHIRTLQWLPFISWGLIHYDRVVSLNLPNLPQYKLKTNQHVLVQQWIINHAKTRFNWFLPQHFFPSIAQNKYLTSWLQYTSGSHLQLIVGLDRCPITFSP